MSSIKDISVRFAKCAWSYMFNLYTSVVAHIVFNYRMWQIKPPAALGLMCCYLCVWIMSAANYADSMTTSRRKMLSTETNSAIYRTAAMKLKDQKANHQSRVKLRRQSSSTPVKTSGVNVVTAEEMRSMLPTWRSCHCFQCVPIGCGNQTWASLFQSAELNVATHITWFLSQHLRYLFSATAKGTFSSYKMGLPQLTRISTMVTHDGLQYKHMYHAAWVMRLRNQPFDINEGPVFPRTLFGGIAQFLDFDEINMVSLTHSFMRLYVKSQMNELRCMKITDASDLSDMFYMMLDIISDISKYSLLASSDQRCQFHIEVREGIKTSGQSKYSDKTLCLLAGMDRVYKCIIEQQVDTFRQNNQGRYAVILWNIFWTMAAVLVQPANDGLILWWALVVEVSFDAFARDWLEDTERFLFANNQLLYVPTIAFAVGLPIIEQDL